VIKITYILYKVEIRFVYSFSNIYGQIIQHYQASYYCNAEIDCDI